VGKEILGVCSVDKSLSPEIVGKFGRVQHGTYHVIEGPVNSFGHTIELRSSWRGHLSDDALLHAELLESRGPVFPASITAKLTQLLPCLCLHLQLIALEDLKHVSFSAKDEDSSVTTIVVGKGNIESATVLSGTSNRPTHVRVDQLENSLGPL
jgi:hypothetical protein